MVHVFLIGSKGIPARYGGFETFVHHLTARKTSPEIAYHVSCMRDSEEHFCCNGADCMGVRAPLPGAPGRILHVSRALSRVENWMKAHPGAHVVVYILGCRIGPLLIPHADRLHRLGAVLFCNPDGLEWRRDKWSWPVKRFLRCCEACLVTQADLVICDSRCMQAYVRAEYGNRVKRLTHIAYGADTALSSCSEERLQQWYGRFGLQKGGYYLIVGRFVPENNYETMLREFMKSATQRQLVIVTNVEHNAFYRRLCERTGFECDPRIRFVGTVYEAELLKRIREEAYGYLHGHEVGGTNPSLLEALASTPVNLLLDVGFNREVAADSALYWHKGAGSLAGLIDAAERMPQAAICQLHRLAARRVREHYSWPAIVRAYEQKFTGSYEP